MHVETILIRPAVNDRSVHPLEDRSLSGCRAFIYVTYNAAHVSNFLLEPLTDRFLTLHHFLDLLLLQPLAIFSFLHQDGPSDSNKNEEEYLYLRPLPVRGPEIPLKHGIGQC